MNCANCNRPVTRPIFAGRLAFGSKCYRKVCGTKRTRKPAREVVERDPRKRDLFEGAAA